MSRSSSYRCPYQGHLAVRVPIARLPMLARTARWCYASTQDVYASRAMLAEVLGMPAEKVRVQYYEGSGTFGRSCYEDAAQAAAILSQAVGKPVRVQYMRWDEHGWDNYGPAHLGRGARRRRCRRQAHRLRIPRLAAWLDRHLDGRRTWRCKCRPRNGRRAPARSRSTDEHRLDVRRSPNRRVVSHARADGRISARRGAALAARLSFAFASEQTIDELAHARQDGSARVPPQQHRRQALARRARCGGGGRELDAARRGRLAVGRRRRDRTRHRARHASRVLRRRGGRDRGQQATGEIVAKRLYGALDAGLDRQSRRWSRTRSSGR